MQKYFKSGSNFGLVIEKYTIRFHGPTTDRRSGLVRPTRTSEPYWLVRPSSWFQGASCQAKFFRSFRSVFSFQLSVRPSSSISYIYY